VDNLSYPNCPGRSLRPLWRVKFATRADLLRHTLSLEILQRLSVEILQAATFRMPKPVERCPPGPPPPYLCPQAVENKRAMIYEKVKGVKGKKLEESCKQSLVLGINADIVDEHLLGELCAGVGAAGPDSTDRYIHNHEKRMIENPLAADGPLRLG
jgi:hypothetical protein